MSLNLGPVIYLTITRNYDPKRSLVSEKISYFGHRIPIPFNEISLLLFTSSPLETLTSMFFVQTGFQFEIISHFLSLPHPHFSWLTMS